MVAVALGNQFVEICKRVCTTLAKPTQMQLLAEFRDKVLREVRLRPN
jgi:hypothetical protein